MRSFSEEGRSSNLPFLASVTTVSKPQGRRQHQHGLRAVPFRSAPLRSGKPFLHQDKQAVEERESLLGRRFPIKTLDATVANPLPSENLDKGRTLG